MWFKNHVEVKLGEFDSLKNRNVFLLGSGPLPEGCKPSPDQVIVCVNGSVESAYQNGWVPHLTLVELNTLVSKKPSYHSSQQAVLKREKGNLVIYEGNLFTRFPTNHPNIRNKDYSRINAEEVAHIVKSITNWPGFFQSWESQPSSGATALALLIQSSVRSIHLAGFSLVDASHNFSDEGHDKRVAGGTRVHSRPDVALISMISMEYDCVDTCHDEIKPLLTSFPKGTKPRSPYLRKKLA